ncbi:MAG: right-handed parallel beta-helix repeat-containing protein, partial [Methanosarcinales archaeon]|nr:right-handed parallel beta-helix repeat-containing protein [Methanosarcinales archaeon]
MVKNKANKTVGKKAQSCIVTLTALAFVPLPVHADDWWNTSFQYGKNLTIDNDMVDAALTDFPVLVKLTSDNNDFSKAQSNGEDIRFTNHTVSSSSQTSSGIALAGSSSNILVENEITETGSGGSGIKLTSSSNQNNITSNVITCSGGSYGISLDGSSHDIIINNTVKNRDYDGLYLIGTSNYTTIRDNEFINNVGGVTINGGSHNTITDNNISSNKGVASTDPRSGVSLYGTGNETYKHRKS